MATNKKITQLDELTPATWADDDVIAIVDISAQETKKIQLSTFRGAVTGVSSLNASTPLTVDSATGDVTISVAINGGGTINAVFDEDNMASNSPTALATQQSIKAYVDSQVGTVDTLAEILANGNTSGGTNIVVSSGDVITTNTINETTAASGVTIDGVLVKDGEVDGRDVSVDGTKLDTVETNADVTDTANVTAAGALMDSELTNIAAVKALDQGVATTDSPSFAGLTATTTDINGGTIDGTVIGGSSAAAGTFTTFTSTGIDDNATSTAITIDSSENVGIGTLSPTAELDIESTSPEIHLNDSDGVLGAAVTSRMIFQASGSTQGVVGLGTSSGTMAVTNNQGNLLLQADTNNAQASSYVGFTVDNAEKMRIDSSGNVGIGTSSPGTPLHVEGAVAGSNLAVRVNNTDTSGYSTIQMGGTDAGIYRNGSAQTGYGGASSLNLITVGAHPIAFSTSNTPRVTIDSSGNVGIGVSTVDTALGTKLHVAGTIRADTGSASANPAIVFDHDNFGDADANYIMLDRTSEAMRFNVNAAERMRIDSSGNVGIGTASPAVPLDVVGNIRSSTGVLFGTDTAAANLLDDYEEGDWTPTIGTGTTVSSDAAYNASFTAGKYTKVGRVVHCSATLRLTDKGTQSGNISILGLPFTSANNVGSRATWSLWFHGAADLDLTGNTDGTIMMYQAHNTAYIQVRVKDPATAAGENVEFADISDTVYVQISGSYIAA